MRLANYANVRVLAGAELFGALMALVEGVLGCSQAEALDIMKLRMGRMAADSRWCEPLLDMDEARECLDRQDEKKAVQQQKAAKSAVEEKQVFTKCYASERRRVQATASASQSGKRAKQERRAKVPAARPTSLPCTSTIPHSEAKLYAPEGGFVWRSLTGTGAWEAHFPPYPRISRSWSRYGENESLRPCLVELWTRWCEVHAMEPSACPVAGIFEAPPAEGTSAASSSRGGC